MPVVQDLVRDCRDQERDHDGDGDRRPRQKLRIWRRSQRERERSHEHARDQDEKADERKWATFDQRREIVVMRLLHYLSEGRRERELRGGRSSADQTPRPVEPELLFEQGLSPS